MHVHIGVSACQNCILKVVNQNFRYKINYKYIFSNFKQSIENRMYIVSLFLTRYHGELNIRKEFWGQTDHTNLHKLIHTRFESMGLMSKNNIGYRQTGFVLLVRIIKIQMVLVMVKNFYRCVIMRIVEKRLRT